ncbi:MAG: peptidoglycan editing factor PgeF [Desulfobacteria bacterium]
MPLSTRLTNTQGFALIRNYSEGTAYYQFPHLAAFSGLAHGVFTRDGGNSTGNFHGLNLSYDVGDHKENVRENRSLIKYVMEMPHIFSVRQVHGSRVRCFSQQDAPDIEKDEADALITDIPGRLLLVKAADCQSILLFDPVRNVAANIHSGWRGSVQNIIGKTVSVMSDVFGCRASNLICGIGPSLGPCCAEFLNHSKELPRAFERYEVNSNHFDFRAVSRDQLKEAGLSAKNILTSRICTRCSTDRFFSFRKEKRTGRFGAVIGIR